MSELWGRKTGGIYGVVPADSKFSGGPGVGVPVQGKKPRKAKVKFHVSALEVRGGHLAGGNGTVTAVCRRPGSLNKQNQTSAIS